MVGDVDERENRFGVRTVGDRRVDRCIRRMAEQCACDIVRELERDPLERLDGRTAKMRCCDDARMPV